MSNDDASLRERATARLAATKATTMVELEPAEMRKMIHELQVHQVELELQNEELVRARGEIEVGLARYADLYEGAPIGYLTLGRDGEILQANVAAARVFALERSGFVGCRLHSIIRVDDRVRLVELIARLFDGAVPASCDVHVEHEGATALVVELAGAPSQDGRHCRVIATDVTATRHSARVLTDSEIRYRSMFELSREALLTLTPPGWHFSSGNRAAVALFGARDVAELATQSMWDCSPELQSDGRASKAIAATHLDSAMRDGVAHFEWTFRRGGGEPFAASVTLTRMDLADAAVLHAVVRDQTEHRARQAGMAQADRLASMGLLAASVAHEVNNPLAYVLANLESLVSELPRMHESPPPSTAEALLEHARDALHGTQRIRDVVRGLGSFIAGERAERTRVDVAQALTAAIGMALNELRHRARLITDFGGAAEVWAAKGTLSQVFLNLLINATHGIEEGDRRDARITVRTWTENGSTYVEVGDTGRGITPENVPRVFEPFFTTKAAGKGSGLGLAISRDLILDLGGDITVASVVGEGTRFVVRLPVCGPVEVVPAAAIAPPAPQPKVRGRILVVDDEQAIRAVLRRVLAMHEVVPAASGAQAQAILEQDSAFDVVLCDVMMPGMTGVELHMWLLARNPALAARMVFITGGTFALGTSEYLARVGNVRIDKPFDTAFVKLLIGELVQGRGK